MNIFGFERVVSSEQELQRKSEVKSEKDLKLEFTKKDIPVVEQHIDKKKKNDLSEDDYLRQIEEMRETVQKRQKLDEIGVEEDEDSINEYQVSDFMRSEWNTMAKYAAKLVQPNVA